MTKEELEQLKNPDTQKLIYDNMNMEASTFALQYSDNKDLPVRAIAEQIKYRNRALNKFPSLTEKNIIYEKRAFEQSSSELTAKYKASILSGNNCIDLTGGMGVDALYVSEKFTQYNYCETDILLFNIFEHNLNQFSTQHKIEIHNCDSIVKLKEFPDKHFDWIYADPDRRAGGKRSVNLNYCSPDIPGNLELFRAKSRKMLLKLSPAFDFKEAVRVFPALKQFIVVSVENECKEILLVLDFENSTDNILLKAVMLSFGNTRVVESHQNEFTNKNITGPQKYFYEPDAAIIKAGLASKLADQLTLTFVSNEVDYLTSETVIDNFPGRTFEINTVFEYKPDNVKKYLIKNKITKANVAKRAFPLTVEEFRKKFRLKDGGEDFIFLTKDEKGKLISIFCKK